MSTIQSPPRPTDPTSRAVRLILDAPQFDVDRADKLDPHCEVRAHVFTGELIEGWDFAAILDQPWSDGERVALQIAADLYNGTGGAVLSDVILVLDRELQTRVLQALRIRVGLDEVQHLTADMADGLACIVCGGQDGAMVPVPSATRQLFRHEDCEDPR